MKLSLSVLGALIFSFSSLTQAEDAWYLGGTAGHYVLDSERAIEGDFEGSQLGLQLGKYIAEDLAIELGYGSNAGHDDFDIISLASVKWLGDDAANWRPYFMLGLNHYDFKEQSNLSVGHDGNSTQTFAGIGMGGYINDSVQMRADIRGMLGWEDLDKDVGIQFSINHVFGRKSQATAPVAAPAPAPEPAPVIEKAPETRTITIRLNVEFEFNKDVVLAVYGDQLEAIAAAMQVHEDIELVLEGHTDSRGSDAYNDDLSSRRAEAVKRKLSDDYGIAAERISAVGYGESRPIASNDTDEGRARNRRVVGEMSFSEVVSD
ncbi:MAG: OmpA family protein [Porticoccaceae bacterium]|jgi:OOP family OmpA-OmpF porin|nr:OmpA family protein [Porticoccaceae bacterium]MBT5578301.1 OmpA family protein [Porticoccaceae bacterium]MBT7375762.1 OmpA family protein [Porticoccaceae bacterium]